MCVCWVDIHEHAVNPMPEEIVQLTRSVFDPPIFGEVGDSNLSVLVAPSPSCPQRACIRGFGRLRLVTARLGLLPIHFAS